MTCLIHNGKSWTLTDSLTLFRDNGAWQLHPGPIAESEPGDAVATFLSDGRDGCLLVTGTAQPARVNNVAVRGGLQPLCDGDRVEVEGSVLRVHITCEARQGVWEQAENVLRCPVCRATLSEGDAVVWCGRCDTPHHQRCFAARQGRCGVYGCPAAHAPQVAEGGTR